MSYKINTNSIDFFGVIEKTLNSSGVKIKMDFDNLSDVLDFSEHDAKIRKEMEDSQRQLVMECEELKVENQKLQEKLLEEKNMFLKIDGGFLYVKSNEAKLIQENKELLKKLEECRKQTVIKERTEYSESFLGESKGKIPSGIYVYFVGGLAKMAFFCPDCGKHHSDILSGNPFKCECGCRISTSLFIYPEGE